ncbi:MAG: hypothetical protein AAGB93_08040 [Planctomycetota bacterium]
MTMLSRSLLALVTALASTSLTVAAPQGFTIHRVSASAPAGGDGTTWGSAFQSIDDALAASGQGDRIWVAEGVYRPTVALDPSDPRSRTFAPGFGVRLYGGFRGDEQSFAERAGLFRSTVLDGDLGVPGDPSDNAYNVVRLEGNGARQWVDGFVIRGGNGDSTGLARGGGAIAAQLGQKTIRNVIFFRNRGRFGGALLSQLSIMSVRDCWFLENESTDAGGACWATSSFVCVDTEFTSNVCSMRGGAVYMNQGGLDTEGVPITRFQNCLFRDNFANNGGAAFVGDPSGPISAGKAIWSGCTFFRNSAAVNGAAITTNVTPSNGIDVRLFNSIVWGNTSGMGTMLGGDPAHYSDVRYNLIENGWVDAGNIDADPMFQNEVRGVLRLLPGSPAIDAGDNELALRDNLDLDGDGNFSERTPLARFGAPRRVDDPAVPDTGAGGFPVTDLGCYERVP